ncbi:MAG: DUF4276 family protein [Chloroflexaceae bacterium]|nr:DUF4276 family protein [Chloroflexaceae bacterium]
MVRLYLFAEGQTEQTFADIVIKPHLAHQYGVFMQNSVLIAHGKKKGKTHRGGGRNYEPMKNDILRLLKQEKGRDVFFTTMIDLYAIHSEFPGLEAAKQFRHVPRERVKLLEKSFAEDIGDARFIPHLQLHEYEAYLFCDPTCFASRYDNCSAQIAALQALANQYETPELINDGATTAPSKRIIAQFPNYKKAKATDGPLLAKSIGLQVIRDRCPHFNEWLCQLEALSTQNTRQ